MERAVSVTLPPTIEKFFADAGLAIFDDERATIQPMLTNLTTETINALGTAIANHLPSGGIKSLEWGDVKGDILASLPELDDDAKTQVNAFLDWTNAQLQAAAQSSDTTKSSSKPAT